MDFRQFSTASWSKLKILTVVGVIGMVPILLFIRELDIMLTDEQSAYSMESMSIKLD